MRPRGPRYTWWQRLWTLLSASEGQDRNTVGKYLFSLTYFFTKFFVSKSWTTCLKEGASAVHVKDPYVAKGTHVKDPYVVKGLVH